VPPDVTGYDAMYAEMAAAFGGIPDPLLASHHGLLERDHPVLDVGCGQGRNALFLARRGVTMVGIDPSEVAARAATAAARAEDLPVTVEVTGFDRYSPPTPLGGVLLFGLFPDLTRKQIQQLVHRSHTWLAPGGLVFAVAFTTEDASYASYRDHGTRIGAHSFDHSRHGVRTFLDPGELTALFDGWTLEHSWEGFGPEHRHGDGPPERHAKAHGIYRRGPSP
jgi:SAM-dependent methyltransferase